jgi:hypothetical protein
VSCRPPPSWPSAHPRTSTGAAALQPGGYRRAMPPRSFRRLSRRGPRRPRRHATQRRSAAPGPPQARFRRR